MTIRNREWLDQQYAALYEVLGQDEGFAFWLDSLPEQIEELVFTRPHGKRQLWLDALAGLPAVTATACGAETVAGNIHSLAQGAL